MELKFSKLTKSNDQGKILKMLSREEELSRNQGKWTRTTSIHKNKKKYDRKQNKKSGIIFFYIVLVLYYAEAV